MSVASSRAQVQAIAAGLLAMKEQCEAERERQEQQRRRREKGDFTDLTAPPTGLFGVTILVEGWGIYGKQRWEDAHGALGEVTPGPPGG